ncbi:hypothetical protein [Marmoricola sp. RAF53]|uniref:hypothetical protein n=1 Tax=Marmoricola sp. RAF53 TaxID=3233059 RepID=UPI003F95B675
MSPRTWWGGERRERPPVVVVESAGLPRGEKVLAHGQDGDRWLLGTRVALVLVQPGQPVVRLPWEQVQAADWDQEAESLRVTEVGEYGRPRASYVFTLDDPDLLLQLVRERVTASVVLQRGHLVSGKRGFKVIGRRSPEGRGPITWMFEFDPGIDPDDPLVAVAAEAALAEARGDVGE